MPATALTTRFKWRDREGKFHRVQDMETRHLFYTLRMIWNHTMPVSVQFRPFHQYHFDDFYTTAYMKAAIIHIGHELVNRKNIMPWWQRDLDKMAQYFADMRPRLPAHTK